MSNIDEQKFRTTLQACGLECTAAEVPPSAPSVAKAIQLVAGMEVEPTSSIDATNQGAQEELDRQWHEKTGPVLTTPGAGEFFILAPGSGGADIGWIAVRDTIGSGLPSRVSAVTGSHEFVALSADGRILCAVSEEEDEYWIVVRSLS